MFSDSSTVLAEATSSETFLNILYPDIPITKREVMIPSGKGKESNKWYTIYVLHNWEIMPKDLQIEFYNEENFAVTLNQ